MVFLNTEMFKVCFFVRRTADGFWYVYVWLQDPHLRNLESMFALQQKIVEAAIKLANEGDLCKTVRKKRRNNFLDSRRKLEDIEREINTYRIKKGKKPTQRASLILAGTYTPLSEPIGYCLMINLPLGKRQNVFSFQCRHAHMSLEFLYINHKQRFFL